ncbi:MAG: hypothetical protein ABFC24_07030 [Methanoregulaceae archaeon]
MTAVAVSLQDIQDQEICLIVASAGKIREENINLIKMLHSRDNYVLVISLNQPYDTLKRAYEKNGVSMDKVYIIDTVTKYAMGHDHEPVNNCRFVNNPGNLTDIGIAVTVALSSLKGKKVSLLFDSVNAMLIYISSQNITRFIHFVTTKLRLMNFSGIFLAVEKGLDPDVFSHLISFVDRVIDVEEEA